MALAAAQKKLIGHFFVVTLAFSAIMALIHVALNAVQLATFSFFMYVPAMLIGAIIIDYFYFRKKIRNVGFKGAGVTTVPTVYYMAMLATPSLFLNGVAILTDRVVEIEHVGQLRDTSEKFIHIAQIEPRINEMLDTVSYQTDKDEDGFETTRFQYTALVPLGSAGDETWIVMNQYEALNHGETDAVIHQMQKRLWQSSREKALTFPYAEVQYVVRITLDRPKEILNAKKINALHPIFLHASLESATSHRINWVWLYGGTYLLLSIFFIGAVAFGHHEEIIHD